MSSIVARSTPILPAPVAMPADVERALSVALNHLEPDGMGFRIVSTNAPSDHRRRDFSERRGDLHARLTPAGRVYAARRVGEMANATKRRDTKLSQREADAEFNKIVEGVMDLPAFAIHEAASDFELGRQGEGWMPRLADFRIHALGKCQRWRTELAQLDKVCAAKVVVIRSDPVRKAALLAMARRSVQAMPVAGRAAEPDRVGHPIADRAPPETPEAALTRLLSEANDPIAPLSREALKAEMQGEG